MGKHNWEYKHEGKNYKVQSLTVFYGESKFYQLNRKPAHSNCGEFKQIDENNFVFVWNNNAR